MALKRQRQDLSPRCPCKWHSLVFCFLCGIWGLPRGSPDEFRILLATLPRVQKVVLLASRRKLRSQARLSYPPILMKGALGVLPRSIGMSKSTFYICCHNPAVRSDLERNDKLYLTTQVVCIQSHVMPRNI